MPDEKRVNASPLLVTSGKVFSNGAQVADAVKFMVKFKPKVWEGKRLSDRGTHRRWTGYDVEVNLVEWKTNRRYKTVINEFLKTGKTPEFTFQGIQEDKNSDFYDENGADEITCIGCVPTSDISLLELDTDGDVSKIDVTFGAKDIIY